MATKVYDVAVKTGEYTDAQGQTKGRYENVGAIMKGDNGSFLMLKKTFNPAGVPDLSGRNSDSVLCSLFAPNNNQQGGQQAQPAQQSQQQQQTAPSQQQAQPDGIPF